MEQNQLLRKLRIERKLTQQQLSTGISTRTTLNSYEHDGSKISFYILSQYLQRMNISFEEFEYMLNDDNFNFRKKLANQTRSALDSKFDPEFAENLLSLYHENYDFYFYGLYAQYYLVRWFKKDKLEDDTIDEIKDNVRNYLDGIDTWGRFELSLFSNCLFIFDQNYINFQFKETIVYMKLYSDSSNLSGDRLKFVINASILAYTRNDYEGMTIFLKELRIIAQTSNSLEARVVIKVLGLLNANKNGSDNQTEKDKLLRTLNYLDEKGWANFLRKHYITRD
ncbi:Rgg/GadR/MutR family transcriptional regulator [Lapidilactobacillus bayanensis]|uniref:Rgg/GadR/MutR family transcriptional regulator n=1 Tax=Lapidilactobacillus bayanensis TaxID=2485998 RepID=UPI000F769CD6|nr:Rgg/GadR/MutR family transcriptional regulator [Lapidilactobacillus bayanensis]